MKASAGDRAATAVETVHKKNKKPLVKALVILAVILLLALIFCAVNAALARMYLKNHEFAAAGRCFSNIPIARSVFSRETAYAEAGALLEGGRYEEAAGAFRMLGGYSDAAALADEAAYQAAGQKDAAGLYDAAISLYESLGDYLDSERRVLDEYEKKGLALVGDGSYDRALEAFGLLLARQYAGASDLIAMTHYKWGKHSLSEGDWTQAYSELLAAGGYPGAARARAAAEALLHEKERQ